MLLENFLESIESLPVDTKRNMTLMGELDKRANEAVDDAKRRVEDYLHQVHSLKPVDRSGHIDEMNKRFQEAIDLTEQKQAVALQTYQLIDKHIRRLDSNLATILRELEADQAKSSSEKRGNKNQAAASSSSKQRASVGNRKRPLNEPAKGQSRRGRKPKRKRVEEDEQKSASEQEQSDDGGEAHDDTLDLSSSIPAAAKLALRVGQKPEELLLAVDPNEPVYCICKSVSYGEMIACDNPDCVTEWYHLGCVNLKVIPRGKWFCPTCREAKSPV